MITEVAGGLGSWSLRLSAETPDYVLAQLDYFGHVVIVDGPVDVAAVGDGLLTAARYVGVVRGITDPDGGRELAGSGVVFWLGDEDGKGHVIEAEVSLVDATLEQAVAAVLPPTVTLGTIHPHPGLYTGKHRYQSPRDALTIITSAFGCEFRVNPDFTVDVGTPDELYDTQSPDTIIVRSGAGADLDLVALGSSFQVDGSSVDYSTRVVLLGQTLGTDGAPDEVFATGAADVALVPYLDPQGNPVKLTRLISESGQTSGSVQARANLQRNRFGRITRSVKLTAAEYESRGNFAVGDYCYVYDPDSGIVDPDTEVWFRGQVWHPDAVRISGVTWPVVEGMTVAFRTGAGGWVDLTRWVVWESGGNDLVVGDLPRTLAKPSDDPVQVRLDAARSSSSTGDASIPGAPTGLTLVSEATVTVSGDTVATITASWTAPATNTDGSVITDLAYYLVQWRPTFRDPQWTGANQVEDTTVDVVGLVVDLGYDVRVAAVDFAGNIGPWSEVASITTENDDTAPNAPADPVVTPWLGQLVIEYPGTDNLGNPMPPDTNRVDVHVGPPGFAYDATTRVSSLNPFATGKTVVTAPYGVTTAVRLVAVDHAGNVSAASGEVTSASVQAGDGDIAALSVGKLVSGTLDALVVIGDRITTAETGARVEVNTLGLQKYEADEKLTVSITGTENLLVGTYKTALTGRRIEMGAAGQLGEVSFVAPDGAKSFIRAYTESTGLEAVQFGTVIPGTNSLWNRINYNTDEWANYRANRQDFYFGTTDGFFVVRQTGDRGAAGGDSIARFRVDPTTVVVWDAAGVARLQQSDSGFVLWGADGDTRAQVTDGDTTFYRNPFTVRPFVDNAAEDGYIAIERTQPGFGSTSSSAQVAWINPAGYGARMKLNMTLSPPSNLRMEVRTVNDNGYEHLWASSFDVNSDVRNKRNVRDFAPATGPGEMVRAMRVRQWDEPDRDVVTDRGPALAVGRRGRLGLVAQEAPADVVVGDPADELAIDLYALVSLLIAHQQELDARLAGLEPRGPVLPTVPDPRS